MAEAKQFLKLAECAYQGLSGNANAEPLAQEDLPNGLLRTEMYNPNNGLFDIPGGMKVLFCKSGQRMIIGFAGTQVIDKIATLGADIQQLTAPSLMYLRAVGIVKMFCECYSPDYEIVAVGHSLGGGLAQLAVLANCSSYDNLYGVAFNSAGLSKETISEAGGENAVITASDRISHYRAKYDPVSEFGALIGYVKDLENASFPWHCISNIERCF